MPYPVPIIIPQPLNIPTIFDPVQAGYQIGAAIPQSPYFEPAVVVAEKTAEGAKASSDLVRTTSDLLLQYQKFVSGLDPSRIVVGVVGVVMILIAVNAFNIGEAPSEKKEGYKIIDPQRSVDVVKEAGGRLGIVKELV